MSNCETWSSLGSLHELSAQVEHFPDDLESLTNQLVESLAPEIDQVIAILRKLQLPLDGIPMPGEEGEEKEEEEEQEYEEEVEGEEVGEGKLGGRHLATALIQLCRADVEKSTTEEDAEEATVYVAIIQVLRGLEMNTAADCLGRMAQIWNKNVEELSSSHVTAIPSTDKAIPEEPPLRSHRDVLRETLSAVIDRLVITDTLLSILIKKSVINQNMIALILGRPNRQQQVAQLVELLMQLGPYSLQVFIEALTETDNVALANALKWSLRYAPQDTDN